MIIAILFHVYLYKWNCWYMVITSLNTFVFYIFVIQLLFLFSVCNDFQELNGSWNNMFIAELTVCWCHYFSMHITFYYHATWLWHFLRYFLVSFLFISTWIVYMIISGKWFWSWKSLFFRKLNKYSVRILKVVTVCGIIPL